MANQYVNKVEYGNDTLIDLTEDSVTPNTLLPNTTAHNRSGAPISGSASASVLPAVDTDNILGGGAGASTNTQAMLDGLADGYGAIRTDLSDYHVTPSKNRAIPNGTRKTLASVTYTEEANGVIDANGTATGSNSFYYISEHLEWSNEEMVLSGCPSGGDASTYRLIVSSSEDGGATVYASDTGSGVIVPANTGGSTLTLDIYIRVTQNASVSHKKFSPMLCSKAEYDADPTYVPYWDALKTSVSILDERTTRFRRDITSEVSKLPYAVTNIERSGFAIGDYFVGASGYRYLLADKDTYYGGYSERAIINTHHLAIVVITGSTGAWNSTDTTSTGYQGSALCTTLTTTVLNNIKSDFIALFGGTTGLEHLLSHQVLSTTSNNAWAWETSGDGMYITALSEINVYSSIVWSLNGYQTGEAASQLEIFRRYRFNEIFGNKGVWLRGIYSASAACSIGSDGVPRQTAASTASLLLTGLILFK